MVEPFVGEIRMFAGNFAPRSWAFCDGQLLAISQNQALFSLLGTIYGGDGRTTFGLPDLRGRIPVHAGSGPGLSPRRLGARAGQERVTLTVGQLPNHSHAPRGTTAVASSASPGNLIPADAAINVHSADAPDANLASQAIASLGGSQGHANLMPFVAINFIIALFGIYPSRT